MGGMSRDKRAPPELVKIGDAARRTGLHPETLRRWARAGAIEARRVGPRLWMLTSAAVEHLIRGRD